MAVNPISTNNRQEMTLSFSGENSTTAVLSWGLVNIPTPAVQNETDRGLTD